MALMRDWKSQASASNAPVTVAIVSLAAISFLAAWLTNGDFWTKLYFSVPLFASQPWSLLSYPFAYPPDGNQFIAIVFMGYWLWGIGGSVERELRGPAYAGLFLAMAALPALFLMGGATVFGRDFSLAGLYLPVAGITVAWATRNPEATVMLLLVMPIRAKWIGWLTAGAVLFGYGTGQPMLGVLVAIPLLIAFLYAADKIPFLRWGRGPALSPKGSDNKAWLPRERDDAFLDRVKEREREREEREKLRKLLEQSAKDDPEDKR